MAKLFVFGIGGTGSRVIKSLTMLLASGAKCNFPEIVPIIIDVDNSNEDLNRTCQILNDYSAIKGSIHRETDSSFFQTKITNIFPIAGREFRMEIEDVQGKRFGEFIDHQTLRDSNKKLTDLLFSNDNLRLDMQQGFQGNPNLGSIVLNQFNNNNPDYRKFAALFEPGDRIFIISSIHGGTGSSGFPLLLKNLRNADVPLPNPDLIKNARIGAITVLPYFKLQQGKIKSEDFISKSKAALEYYINNVNPSLNSLYYLGLDQNAPNYENHPGGAKQKNAAHFIELAAALAIFDFANQNDDQINALGNRYMEFGINDFDNEVDFSKLGGKTRSELFNPLSRFFFFRQYLKHQINSSVDKQPWSNHGNKNVRITKEFLSSDFYRRIESFNKKYDDWLTEMYQNSPSFKPFELNIDGGKVFHSIINRPPESASIWSWKSNFAAFDDFLNKSERKLNGFSKEQKFIELFNLATQEIINQKFK